MSVPRERATHVEDLPHRYEASHHPQACFLCGAEEDDARHAAWERMEMASKETAAALNRTAVRELGS